MSFAEWEQPEARRLDESGVLQLLRALELSGCIATLDAKRIGI